MSTPRAEAAAYHRDRLARMPERIDPGIRALLVSGSISPAAPYLKAMMARNVITSAIRDAFVVKRLHAVVTPTLPATAAGVDQQTFQFGGFTESVTQSYFRTTAGFNLSGQPAISVPCGFDSAGLPIGLQIAGRPFDEAMVLRVAAAYERAAGWTSFTPPLHATRIQQ